MKIVDDFDGWHQWRRRKTKYDYATMFDGRTRAYERGVDFHSDPESFRASVWRKARREGVKVQTRICGDVVYVQAIKEDA